jgi:hypothetical protein
MLTQKISRFLILLAVMLVLTACYDDDDYDDDYDDEDAELSVDLAITDVDDNPAMVFDEGDQIKFTLSITNEGSETETLTFGDGCVADISIRPEGEDVVFRLTNTIVCMPTVQYITLEPGETEDYFYVWDQVTDDVTPVQVDAGTYIVTVWFGDSSGDTYGDEVSDVFQIQVVP